MLEQEFNILFEQFGVPVFVSREDVTRKAIIKHQKVNESMPNFDDKTIHTNWKLERGMTIVYEGTEYLIISDIQSKRAYEYKAVMRPMTNVFRFVYWTEGVIDYYDRLGNPVYVEGKEPQKVEEDYPCIAQQEGSPTITGSQIRQPEERIIITLPDNYATEQIEINTDHRILNYTYKIVNVNLLQKGLRILTMEWTSSSA